MHTTDTNKYFEQNESVCHHNTITKQPPFLHCQYWAMENQ